MKVDQTNVNPAYWEKILASQELSVIETSEDSSSGVVPQLHELRKGQSLHRARSTNSKDYERLRALIDSDDSFLAGGTGHQIQKERVLERETPSWAIDNRELRKIIETAFPKWRKNAKQRHQAARWAQVVYLFYRMHLPRQHVAAEMKISIETVKNLLKRIRRTANGVRSDNTGKRSRV